MPEGRAGSAGPDAIEFAESLGYELDDWQKWCIDGILSEDALARLIVELVLLLVPRQNGKNIVLEVVELYVFFVLGWPVILHTAHRADTSADHMARLWAVIEANADLVAICDKRDANGKERIFRLDTGAEIRFVTRSKKIGRGRSPRLVVFDEALYLTEFQIQALMSSLSAQSMNEDAPLMIYASSAPLAESAVLHRVRNLCLRVAKAGRPGRRFIAEWSCLPGIDPSDRRQWLAANPGMGVRISPDWVHDNEFLILDAEAFGGERLGIPVLPPAEDTTPPWIRAEPWEKSRQVKVPHLQPGEVTMAYDSHDGWTSVTISAGTLAASYIECIEHRAGVAWLPGRLVELVRKWRPPAVGLDGGNGPSVAVLGEILEAFEVADPPLDPDLVKPLTSAQYRAACESMVEAVHDGKVRRPRFADDEPDQLQTAGEVATKRMVGESAVFDRKTARAPVSPIASASIARALLSEVAVGAEELRGSLMA